MSSYQSDPVLEDVKINIRAILTSCKDDMTYETLIKEYEDVFCEPMFLCGFQTIVELINSIPDVVKVIRGTPNRLRLVHSDMSGHVARLVKQQKVTHREAKRFPSASHLLTKGVRMPDRNATSVSTMSKHKTVIRADDETQYKWPPVSDLLHSNTKKEENEDSVYKSLALNIGNVKNETSQYKEDVLFRKNSKHSQTLSSKSATSSGNVKNETSQYKEDVLFRKNSKHSQTLSSKSAAESIDGSSSFLPAKVQKEIIRNNVDLIFMDL